LYTYKLESIHFGTGYVYASAFMYTFESFISNVYILIIMTNIYEVIGKDDKRYFIRANSMNEAADFYFDTITKGINPRSVKLFKQH
jgi:hypothetical protein